MYSAWLTHWVRVLPAPATFAWGLPRAIEELMACFRSFPGWNALKWLAQIQSWGRQTCRQDAGCSKRICGVVLLASRLRKPGQGKYRLAEPAVRINPWPA